MPPELLQLVSTIGAPAVMALIIVWVFTRRETANVNQDNAITNFSVEFNTERRQLQESNNRITAELMEVRLVQAREEGRREQLEKAMQSERAEWKTERATNDEKFRKMEARILELEKHREQSNRRITELENQIAELERKLASANVEIDLLTAQKRELETQLTYERNRADTLNKLITEIRNGDSAGGKTIPMPDLQMIDTDETVTPLPLLSETKPPDAA